MSKISTYDVVPVPKLADKLIGTSVGGEIEDVTYNFTLQELLDLYIPLMPANNLQGILDFGNTATQDINLFGTITTTYIDVTDTASFLNTYFVGETHVQGGLFDSTESIGTAGQVLTSTGEFVEWVTLPPIFTPNLQQVLGIGNTSDIGIILDAGLEALDVNTDTATINTNITIDGTFTDSDASVGSANQVLSSTVTGVKWVSLPVYSATSPLFFDSATGVFSIQQAASYQAGYLSAADWTTFNGKQNAGNYITALTGEATASGPGAASVILTNSAVISKVLTGFNPTAGTINASDSILTAFGKAQSQINALVGGVQYKGTWNASTNVPTLTSSVGVQGNYYIVSVAGNTNLNGITDWQVGDWAIFSETTWQKVDNTESVTSVNGFTGAVSLTTDNIPEGSVNQYFTQSRARGSLSFVSGSGAYNNLTGVITIPTNTNELTNGANFITLGSLSASSPLSYNNTTGAFTIQVATALQNGYLSATDWSAFNSKQNYLNGTGLVKSTAGTITYITDNSGNWNTAYDRSIVSAAVTGTTTKTLTLTEQDGNTIQASWTDLDTGLTSVGVSMPSAFSVANSPLTTNGTIAITGAGTNLQYIDGTGALRTFPGLTGYVPYTGATQNVDLGTYGLLSDYLQLNISPSAVPTTAGTMSWNNTDGTMDIILKGGNVTLQVGEENVTRVVNKSGIDLLEANYQVVRARKVAEGGAQGQRIAVVLAQGNSENSSTEVLGLVTETILANQEGFITCFGEVKEINTTGSLQGETWVDGDILYLSNTVAGALTNVRPVAPNHSVIVGYVTYAHAVHGKIYMAIDTGYELGELHNVYAPSPTANQSIYWNVANSRYQLNTIGGILGYTPADAATTLTINGTTYDLSANRTWNVGTVTSVAALTLGTSGSDLSSTVANGSTTPVITLNVPTASAANRGALSAADWSTFNTKVGSVTASSPLASSGGQTPNITIQQASGSQDGYLSSTDWSTFNNKQAAGNYITSLTGEATASGPGAASVTLNNASVTAKVLTGINITGGTVQATDTMLTAFGKLQNQINGLVGGSIYQGTWNASTNTPALASGVGTKGYYYIVSVAGTTNLDGITDWFVGDWAIFDGTAWQQVDNTDAVVSVNGQTGAVSLTTDNIPEGATNQYFTNTRSRASLSFAAGSGAYNSTTGVITIPTNTNQLTNGASFITLASLSGTAPIVYSNTTGAISITQASASSNGYLSSTDWNTFNNKQAALTNPVTGTGDNNYVSKFTSTGSTIGNSSIYDNGTGVGIGTNVLTSGVFWTNLVLKGGSYVGQVIQSGQESSLYLTHDLTGTIAHTQIFDSYGSFGIKTTSPTGNNYLMYFDGVNNSIGAGNFQRITIYGATGNVFVGNTPADNGFKLEVLGTSKISGTLTLGSTITNGTYTYTLPSATGTLALTSALSGYVPYTGATANLNLGLNNLLLGSGNNGAYILMVGNKGSNYLDIENAGARNVFQMDSIVHTSKQFGGTKSIMIQTSATTGNDYVISFPDASGTVALTSQIPSLANYVTLDTTQTITGQKTISRAANAFSGTTQSFLIDGGAGQAAVTYNSATEQFAYQTFAQGGVAKFEMGIEGTSGNGSFYINANPQFGVTGASIYVKKSTGFVGITSTNPLFLFSVNNASDIWHTAIGNITSTGHMLRIGGAATSGSTKYSTLGAYANGVDNAGTLLVLQRDGGNVIIGGGSTVVDSGALFQVKGGSAEIRNSYNGLTRLNIVNTTAGASAYVESSYTSDAAGNGSIGKYSTTTTTYKIITASNTYLYNGGSGDIAILNDFATGAIRIAAGGSTTPHLTIASTGASTFNGQVTVSTGISTPFVLISTTNNQYLYIKTEAGLEAMTRYENPTAGSWYTGIRSSAGIGSTSSYHIFSSVLADDVLALNTDGTAKFKSSVTATSFVKTGGTSTQYLMADGSVSTLTGTFVTLDTTQTITGAKTISREAFAYSGTTQSFLIDGAGGNGALTINSLSAYAYLNFAQAGTTKMEMGIVGTAGARYGNLYINKNIQSGEAGASITVRKSNGYVGINQVDPTYQLHIYTTDNEGIYLKGTGAGVWMNMQSTGKLWSIGAQTDGMGIYQRTDSAYAFFIADNGFTTIGGTSPTFKFNVYTDADVWHMAIGGSTGQIRFGGQTSSGGVIQAYTPAGVTRALYIQRDGSNAIFGGTTDNGYKVQVNGGLSVSASIVAVGISLSNNAGGITLNRDNTSSYSTILYQTASSGQWYVGMRENNGTNDYITFSVTAGNVMRLSQTTGTATFISSVTATGFFESSDKRLKTIVEETYDSDAIFNIKPKTYIKEGRKEIGYFAQDFENILSSSVSVNDAGYLSLSYTQVHTAKISVIEDEVDVLKNRVSELESKLQKYES